MRKVFAYAFVIFLLVGRCVWAAGKTTVDPNSSDQAVIAQWESDTRLAQKVTYEARHKAVKVILADLSDMTGVTLNAGFNKQDWQVRDRKMNIFAKDVHLVDLISSIARTMKFKWSINKTDVPWTYRLYMDRKTLASANAELSKAQGEYDKEVQRRREDFLNTMESWDDDLTDDELEALREDDPYTYRLHTSGMGAAFRGLLNDVPGMKENFLNKQDKAYPIAELSPETQQLILNVVKSEYGEDFSGDSESKFTLGGVGLDLEPDEFDWKAYEDKKFAGIGINIYKKFFVLDAFLGDRSNPMVQWIAEKNLLKQEKGLSSRQAWEQMRDRYFDACIEDAKQTEKNYPTEPQPDVPDEPDLHKKIKVEPEEKKWLDLVDYQAATAKASDFAVVSDSYKFIEGYAGISKSETELLDVLSAICEGYRYNWDKHGLIIEFRSKDWFKRRTAQIPDEWVEKWRANLKKNGYMSIDDYAQIATLTTEQIRENFQTDNDFHKLGIFTGPGSKEIWLMRLYATLSASQKKELFSDIGLNVLTLGTDQWEYVHRTCREITSGKSTILRCSASTDENGTPAYAFRLTDTETRDRLGIWTVSMLKYEPPEPEEPKAEEKKTDSASGSSAADTTEKK
ncbi:hypothetical protein LLG46_13995 [bacterium]|nr:hypothetical protein [bacterium]